MYKTPSYLSWVEISESALRHNVQFVKKLLQPKTIFCAVVKSNAYGHDLVKASQVFVSSGVDWLAVHSINEAQTLRDHHITCPIYVLGYVMNQDLERAIHLDCRLIVYNVESIEALGSLKKPVRVHIKIETGTHRQGVMISDLPAFIDLIQEHSNIIVEGVSTHFANIEDTERTEYYEYQIKKFENAVRILKEKNFHPMQHVSAGSAVLLFPDSHMDMVRAGVICYGMWPSALVKKAFYLKYPKTESGLIPAFTWRARIAQIKKIPPGAFVGYGCTYQTTRETVVGIIPVGYYDGYVRALGGKAHVLVHGKKAKVLGRISMNNFVIDLTDISGVVVEDIVTLLGKDGNEEISAEQFADWAETINYEVTNRVSAGVNANTPRIMVD